MHTNISSCQTKALKVNMFFLINTAPQIPISLKITYMELMTTQPQVDGLDVGVNGGLVW